MVLLKGWKFAAFVGTLIGAVGLTTYPIIISPMINPDQYKKAQIKNRAGFNQEDIQPGNMRIWTDPFERKNEGFDLNKCLFALAVQETKEMNIQNNRGVETVYSTTYVEDYLETVEYLPDEVQRLLSRMLLLDVETKNHFKKVRHYFSQLIPLKRKKYNTIEEMYKEIGRIQQHITITLMKSQNIGDQKIQVAQQIQDFVDNRLRQLEIDRKSLETAQKNADAAEAASSSTSSSRDLQHRTTGEVSGTEKAIKRVRRVRLGPSIIPKTATTMSTTSSQSVSASQSSIVEGRVEVTPCSSTPRSSVVMSSVSTTNVEKEKVKSSAQISAVIPMDFQESRKEKDIPVVVTTPSLTKKKSNDSESNAPIQEREAVVSTEKNSDEKVLRTPKKKEKEKKHQLKTSERKQLTTSSTSSTTTRTAATKRKARQVELDDSPPFTNVDPDEPRYCLCDQISYGEMIGCDNDLCPIEWFHFSCVSLTSKPKGKWFCPRCRGERPNVMKCKEIFLKELAEYNREKEANAK